MFNSEQGNNISFLPDIITLLEKKSLSLSDSKHSDKCKNVGDIGQNLNTS